jgi:hypothetical protein
MPELLQLLPQLDVVEDLAVEDEHVATVRAHHGLMPRGGEIQDGEAAEAERHRAVRVDTGIVRPAVDDRVAHRLDDPHIGTPAVVTDYRDEATHSDRLLRSFRCLHCGVLGGAAIYRSSVSPRGSWPQGNRSHCRGGN